MCENEPQTKLQVSGGRDESNGMAAPAMRMKGSLQMVGKGNPMLLQILRGGRVPRCFLLSHWHLCALTLQRHCPLVLLQSGSNPLAASQLQGPHVGFPHQPLGHCWSILQGKKSGWMPDLCMEGTASTLV